VEVRSSTHVSYLLTLASVNAGKFRERGNFYESEICKRAETLGSLFSVGILCLTVVSVFAIGIVSAYAAVIGILHAFASQSRPRPTEKPILTPTRTQAAHAGGS
jgi:hypothetical protein